jgi:hypothetical protein
MSWSEDSVASEVCRILILCKTYPSPSAKYAETSCVAGMDDEGRLIRLYPVPFRLIGDDRQFRKWQWITARLEKSRNDNRPESHKLYVDTLDCDATELSTAHQWQMRRPWLEKLPVFEDFADVQRARQASGTTLALVKPARVLGLDITPVSNPAWTDDEKAKLIRLQQQCDLFDDSDTRTLAQLRKLPYDFHYRYECQTPDGLVEHRHKIVDWEIGALYWNVHRRHGKAWETPFRDKLENFLPAQDLMFLMGTIHRFPDQWLIISLIYPPKQPPSQELQGSLF